MPYRNPEDKRANDQSRYTDPEKRARRNYGKYIGSPSDTSARLSSYVEDGVVLIGSDAHYWPGPPSTANRAFVHACKHLKPSGVILNGDVIDGARISRWNAGAWADLRERPTVIEELGVAQERLREIRQASGTAECYWTLGNHDARFETFLLKAAPEMAGIGGTRLKDHFPEWQPCWSVWINPESEAPVVVKHRFRQGVHAPHNNTKDSGLTIVTGHLHSLKVMPWSDFRGTRWGVDGGTLAIPHDKPFIHYTEDNPVNWRSGFVVLSFVGGRLMWPEVCWVVDERAGLACFRGALMKV